MGIVATWHERETIAFGFIFEHSCLCRIEWISSLVLVLEQRQHEYIYTLLEQKRVFLIIFSWSWVGDCSVTPECYLWTLNDTKITSACEIISNFWHSSSERERHQYNAWIVIEGQRKFAFKGDGRSPSTWIQRRRNATKRSRCWFHTTRLKMPELSIEAVNRMRMFLHWICHQRALDALEQGIDT